MTDQAQALAISKRLSERVPDLLDYFDVKYYYNSDKYHFPCPVHGGDNKNGCTIFLNGIPNWRCWTHSCHEKYMPTLLGFIRGVLSFSKGEMATMSEVYSFCETFLECKLKDIPRIKVDRNIHTFNKMVETFQRQEVQPKSKLTRDYFIKLIEIPSGYFNRRGYNKDILERFDVGDCVNEGRFLSGRAVVPIYNFNGEFSGATGRAIGKYQGGKWLNTPDLDKSKHLYALNMAKEHIIKTRKVYIVEGPPDVWKLFEAGFENSVAILGTSFSDEQLLLLEKSGCTEVIILTDMDEAGRNAAEHIKLTCGKRFNYKIPEYPAKDIGELMDVKNFLESI